MTKGTILVLLAFVVAAASFLNQATTGRAASPNIFNFIEWLASAILLYWWYHLDKVEHQFRAGAIQNIGVVVLSIVALPVYFVRSRGWRRGAVSIALGLAFLVSVGILSAGAEHFASRIAL